MTDSKIIVAIDSSNQNQALNIIDQLDSKLCMIKIGSVNFNSLGNLCIDKAFEKGFDIFRSQTSRHPKYCKKIYP